jgi:hypothetical protein
MSPPESGLAVGTFDRLNGTASNDGSGSEEHGIAAAKFRPQWLFSFPRVSN